MAQAYMCMAWQEHKAGTGQAWIQASGGHEVGIASWAFGLLHCWGGFETDRPRKLLQETLLCEISKSLDCKFPLQ